MRTEAKCVLVVDDDDDLRDAMHYLLSKRGYAVETAANGREGLAALEAGLRPCVILLDLKMPVMDGFAMRRALLDDPRFADIPVIFISGAADAVRRSDELGAAAVLTKPVDMATIYAFLEQLG